MAKRTHWPAKIGLVLSVVFKLPFKTARNPVSYTHLLAYYERADQAAMGKVLESCQRYVRGFGSESPNLLFTGAPGLGKTPLSLAIAEGVVNSGRLVMYVSAPHLMDELERGKFQKGAAALEYREIIFGCDLLVIDDLCLLYTSAPQSELCGALRSPATSGP